MKFTLSILCVLCGLYTNWAAQVKDTRALVDIPTYAWSEELSISPTGQVWIVSAMNKLMYCNHHDSLWHYTPPLYATKEIDMYRSSGFRKIHFFNKDTAILIGAITAHSDKNSYDMLTDSYYRTTDGGKNWELQQYSGKNYEITTVCGSSNGNIWLGGDTGVLYYSSNYGDRWDSLAGTRTIRRPLTAICMKDSLHGLAYWDEVGLFYTTNNWKSTNSLPTPFEQGLLPNFSASGSPDIRKICYWKNYIVVYQGGNCFYADTLSVQWKHLPLNCYGIEVDTSSDILYAVNRERKIIAFTSPERYRYSIVDTLPGSVLDMNAVNSSLYLLVQQNVNSYNHLNTPLAVYEVKDSRIHAYSFLTNDEALTPPDIIRAIGNVFWGCTVRNQNESHSIVQRIWLRVGIEQLFYPFK